MQSVCYTMFKFPHLRLGESKQWKLNIHVSLLILFHHLINYCATPYRQFRPNSNKSYYIYSSKSQTSM